jgi:L-fuculose-phosphate aldolase
MNEQTLRQQIIDCARRLNSDALTEGNSGNVSARWQQGLLITPTGVPYAKLQLDDLVELNLDGEVKSGHLLPSSEWHFHCAILKARPEINAVVHAHPKYCTALACTGRDIPAFHYMVAVAGGKDIRCAPYATYGTDTLAENAVTALQDRNACLLANHGSLALGENTDEAFALALALEDLAAQYCEVLKLGDVKLLSDQQINEVLVKFGHYGQQA